MTTHAERVRVLRLIARLNVGGPALHVAYLARGLTPRGYETELVAGSLAAGESSMSFVAEELGVSVTPLRQLRRELSPLDDAFSIARVVQLIRAFRPHLLHTHTAKAGAVGRIAALLAGGARPPIVVHTFHGHVLRGYFGPRREAFFRTLERELARVSTRLVAVSPQIRDELVELGVAPAERFSVIRLGLDLEGRAGASRDRGSELRRRLGLPEAAFVVGWVGRMTAIKRLPDVLAGFALLRERGVEATLCLVGDGPDRPLVQQCVRELGLADHVLAVGYQTDVAPYYPLFDVLVLASANEGTPVAAIEALAAGTPVVSTDVGGVRDVVSEGVDGLLIPAGDVVALASALEVLARDPSLRARMGRAGAERARARYGVERLVDDVDALYRELLSAAGLPLPPLGAGSPER